MLNLFLASLNTVTSEGVNTICAWSRGWTTRALRTATIIAVLLAAPFSASAQVNVTTYQYNNQRTSVNGNETILTLSNVNSTDFGKLFSQTVDGYVYAQPLYVPNLTISGAVHNVVYVATEHDSVYAFDADSNTGANAQPLWQTSFLSPGVTTVPNSSLSTGNTDINPEIGITGTPVIDLSTNILYVMAETLENNGTSFVKKLHALDITTGVEKTGSPILISASVTVSGQSAEAFVAEGENQRAGLLLYNGVVYLGFGAHGDGNDTIRGWVLGYAYNGSSFSQVFVYCTEPSSVNGWGGGIWMGGQGLMMDTGTNLLLAVGNGGFDTTITPPEDYGDSILRIDLSRGPTVQDYFTPSNQGTLAGEDEDVGSGGIALLPTQSGPNPDLLVQAGKQGTIYVVNRDNMGHFNASTDNVVQEIIFGVQGMFSSPVYFNGKVYFWGQSDFLRAYAVANGTLSTAPTDQGSDVFGFPGAVPTISANGTSNGILWALESHAYSDTGPGGPAVLYAYNAGDLAAGSIYNSNQNSIRDNPGGAIKFAVPIVTNGKVYVGAEGQLSIYGELASGLAAPQINPGSETFSGSITVSITDTTPGATICYTTDGSVPPGSSTSQTYSAPFNVTASSVVNAVAIKAGYINSARASATYTFQAQAPTITSLSKTSGPVGTAVTITGTNFGSSQGTSTVTFNGTAATVTSWSATSLATSVPSGATSGNVVVTVGGVASNGVSFTVTGSVSGPTITSLSTTSGPVGTAVTITGTNLGSSQGTSTVTFNGTAATVTSWSATSLVTSVPSGATSGNVVVTVGGVASNGVSFTVTPTPSITSLSTTSGPVGAAVTITGTNFGPSQGTSTVTFNGTAATVTSWSATSLATSVPSGATSGNVVVAVGGVASNGVSFTVSAGSGGATWGTMNAWLQMNTSSPGTVLTTSILGAGTVGTPIRWFLSTSPITGFTVAASQGGMGGSITVAGTTYPVGSTTQSMAFDHGQSLPREVAGVPTGVPTVVVNGFITFGPPNVGFSAADFDYVFVEDGNGHYAVLDLNNGNGDGTGACYCVRIETDGNGALQSSNTVVIPGHRYSYSLLFDEVGGISKLALYDPSNGFAQVGSTMTVAQKTGGTFTAMELGNVGTGQASGYTSYFEDTMLDWTNHVFPNYPQTGATSPSITSLSKTSGPAGTAVTITGTNFGSSQGTSTVTFNGTAATVTSWSATSLATSVPSGATSGNVVVTAGGVASNGVSFTVSPTPSITSLSKTSGPVGTAVTITGTNFGPSQGTSTATFNGTAATVTSWSATSLATSVPSGASSGNVVVTVGGVASNGVSFTVSPTPTITSLSTTSAPVGTAVTITGTNFGSSQGTSTVTFNGTAATVTSWSATSLATSVPSGATSGNVVVTVGGVASNGVSFTVSPTPSITSLSKTSGPVGTAVTITGTNFGSSQGTSTATFNGAAATATSWSATSLVTSVPSGATSGNVVVTVGGVASNGVSFTVSPTPSITSLSTTSGPVGTAVTITGTNFGSSQGTSTVTFNGTAATVTSWSATSLATSVPSGATSGNVVVTVGGVASNGVSFTVTGSVSGPTITSLSTTSGPVGTAVTITGTNFGPSQGTSTVTFNGTAATVTSWSATSLATSVPSGATSGNVVVAVGGVASNGVSFTVSAGSGGATWGTMNAWLQMNTSSPGTVLTTSILGAGTVGTPIRWFLSTSPITGFTVAASQGGMGGSITVAGTTYPVGSTTQSMAFDHGQSLPREVAGVPTGVPTVVVNGFITFGPPNVGFSAADFDYVFVEDGNGHYAVLDLNNGNGDGTGACYCVRIETDGNGALQSSNTVVIPGHRYSYSLLFDEVGGISKLALYDPSNGFAQVGSTMTVAQKTGGTFTAMELGNVGTGQASGYTSYFEDTMLDWTNHVFPNYPH